MEKTNFLSADFVIKKDKATTQIIVKAGNTYPETTCYTISEALQQLIKRCNAQKQIDIYDSWYDGIQDKKEIRVAYLRIGDNSTKIKFIASALNDLEASDIYSIIYNFFDCVKKWYDSIVEFETNYHIEI